MIHTHFLILVSATQAGKLLAILHKEKQYLWLVQNDTVMSTKHTFSSKFIVFFRTDTMVAI